MKNLFKSLLAFVAGAVIIAACNPEEQPEVPAGTKISVDLTNIANLPARNVPAVTVQVTADGEWLATTPSWITIDPSHATKSTAVTITVADNVDADGNLQGPREGKITLSLVDAEVSAEILVAQDGNADLDTRRTYVKVTEITSGKAYLLVAQKAENTYVVPVLFGPTGTYGYPKVKEVTLESDGSIKMEDASYGLIFTDAGRDAAYTIQQPDGRFIWHQGGYNTWSCAADPTEGNLWKLDHVYDDGTVRICDTDAAGILQYGHGGYDSYAAYGDLDETSILPWLYEDTKAAEIDDSKCFFPSTSVKVAADSVKATFAVTANIPWELTKTEGDWITDFTPKSGSADATITVTFPANTADGAEARTAKFHLASTDGKKTADLTLTQASPAVLTFADIIPTLTTEATSTGAKNALIVAGANKRFILNDGTALMFAYYSKTDIAIGDKVDLSGDAMLYDGCPEWKDPIMSVTSSKNEVKHPEPVVLDEDALAEYEKAPSIKYVEVQVIYDGKNKTVGSHVIYTHAASDVTFEKEKTYKLTGYAIGYSASYKNVSLVVTSCEEVKVEYSKFELSEASAEVEAAAGTKTFKVVADDNVGWTVALPADVTGARLAIAGVEDGSLSAKGTKDVTITYAENKAAGPVEYKVTVTAAADAVVENKTLVYALTQKAPEGSVALTFQWAEGTDVADTVAFDRAEPYKYVVDADEAVEYEVAIAGGNGTLLVKDTDFTIVNDTIFVTLPKNTLNGYKAWAVTVTTANENAETKSLEATLVQGPYEYSDLAEFNAAVIAAGDTESTYIVDISAGVEITKISGKNVFAQNSTGGVLLYGTGLEDKGMDKNGGHTIKGKFTVKAKAFKGLPEVTAVVGQSADATIGVWGGKYPCFEWVNGVKLTIAEIERNYAKYVNAKCKIANVEVTKAFGATKAGEIKDATGKIAIYNYSTDLTVDITPGSKAEYTVVWPTVYNAHQLGLYEASRFKVTSLAGQIVMPKTLSVVKDAEGTSLGAKSTYGGTITYVSSDVAKATVSDAGVVTGVAAGTATITASVPATTVSFLGATIPVTEATATCEVTVTNEAPAPEKKVTWDLTTASYAGATADVVRWTSDQASMSLEKGSSSTAANNYLGGSGSYTHTRVYKDQTLTINPVGVTMTSIVITSTANDYAKTFNTSTWTNATTTVDGTAVTVTPTDGTKAVVVKFSAATRATEITVKYE